MPRVTVVLPTFEQSDFIRRAPDSLLAHSMAGRELVIVDDVSAFIRAVIAHAGRARSAA